MTISPNNAATLTYTVAPHLFSYKNVFDALLSFGYHDPCGREEKKGLLTSMLDFTEQRRIKFFMGKFTQKFSRQLEVSPGYAVVSATCALLSGGKPVNGVVWASSNGLYFRSFVTLDSREKNSKNGKLFNVTHLSSLVSKEVSVGEDDIGVWGDDSSAIRELIPFKDIVSLLPSLALPTKEDDSPYVMGIPNGIVTPNAMQVFTVSPKQIFQFVYIRGVTVVPPSSIPTSHVGNGGNGSSPVLQQHEYNTMKKFHSSLDTLKFCALVERLWEARLGEQKIPLLRDGVDYAEPH